MTNKWYVDRDNIFEAVIRRLDDDVPVAVMCSTVEPGDGLFSVEQAADIAEQICDDWNFSCEELGEGASNE